MKTNRLAYASLMQSYERGLDLRRMRACRPLAAHAAATAGAAHAPRCLAGGAENSRGRVRHGEQRGRARLPPFAQRSLASRSQRALGSVLNAAQCGRATGGAI